MTSEAPLYRHTVLYLSQSFFIKDNQAELLLHAHKYDFDILFFSELAAVLSRPSRPTSGNSLFVIDLDALHNMQADMQDSRKTLMLGELLQRLPPDHSYVYLQIERARAAASCCSSAWSTAIAWPMPKSRSPTMCWSTSCSTCSCSKSAATPSRLVTSATGRPE